MTETRRGQTRPPAFKEEISKDRAAREQSITEPPVANNTRQPVTGINFSLG